MIFDQDLAENLIARTIDLYHNKHLTVSAIQQLRKEFPEISQDVIGHAIDIAEGTLHARQSGKFSDTFSDWLFTKQTFEQSTSDTIAKHHASRFKSAQTILELCTGSGIDTRAFSAVSKTITTIEANHDIASLALRNFRHNSISSITLLYGKAEDILQSDFDFKSFDGLWADPSRRQTDGKRMSIRGNEYQPDLEWIMNLPITRVSGIKISPALTMENLPDGWVREWIGYKNECREQILWKNVDIQDGLVTLVDKQISWQPSEKKNISPKDITYPLDSAQFLVEPHPCLIRCGYLAEFYHDLRIGLFDYRIGYGITSKQPADSSFLSIFEVIEYFPFNYKHLQKRITELNWNKETEIKKRGFPELPDEVRKKLRFAVSDDNGVIILSQKEKQKLVFLAKRIKHNQ